jgi:esterase/lipase superfamily enzyme
MISRTSIVNTLIAFFQNKFPDGPKIDADTDVKTLFEHSRSRINWRAVAREINRIPEIRYADLSIDEASMDHLSTVAELAAELARGRSRPPRTRGPASPPAKKKAAKKAVKKTAKKAPATTATKSLVAPTIEDAPSAASASAPLPHAAHEALPAPPTGKETRTDLEYSVWYGTNRKPLDANDIAKGYSGERDVTLHLGLCKVFVPESHKIGSTGSGWWERFKSGVDDRLKLTDVSELPPTTFWAQIKQQLNSLELADRDAVIFVHGYNVSFEDAAVRAAQIGVDLAVTGAMAFFSWPSRGAKRAYTMDEASIEASELHIANFMVEFAERSGAAKIHIIAHSMGNRGVLRAVSRIASQAEQRTQVPFDQIILAAADVDAETFRNLCSAYARVSRRTTLYVSSRDRAVEASKWLHDFPRAGLLPPVMVTTGIDTINVTNADLTMLGHGYVAEAREVLTDMHNLLEHGDPPRRRFGLKELRTEAGIPYWLIGE